VRLRTQAVAGLVAVVALVAAGCGDDDDGASSSTSVASAATTAASGTGGSTAAPNTASAPGVAPDTVKVGMITSLTGPFASTFGVAGEAAQARIETENAKGGVHGRTIQLELVDDASSPDQNLKAAQTLIEQKDVFAVISVSSFVAGSYRYLNEQGIPVTGAPLGGPMWGQEPNRNMFSYSGGYDPTSPASTLDGLFLKSIGATKSAVLGYGNSPSSAISIKQEVFSHEAAGIDVVYENISIPIGGVDFTAPVLDIKKSGADVVVGSFVEASDVALATALKQGDVDAKQLYFTGYGQSLLDQPTAKEAAQGVYFKTQTAPFELKTPGTEAMLAALEEHAPSYDGGIPSAGMVFGWQAADLMIRGLQEAGQNPTRESFITNLTAVTDYDGAGLLPAPVSFDHFGTYEEQQCAWFVQLDGEQFVPVPADGKPMCGTLIPNSATS